MQCVACGQHLEVGEMGYAPGSGPFCGQCFVTRHDWHVYPVHDEREHQLTRRCWCEPRIEWPCALCEDGQVAGRKCGACDGRGWTTKPQADVSALVVHEAKDGRT